MSEPTVVVVTTEAPSSDASEVPPPSSVTGETATAILPELVSLAATVGTLEAKVASLEEKSVAAVAATEAAQLTADVALTVAASEPATPEPEPEVAAVTEVTVPPSGAAEDGPAKTPAQARPWLSRMLFG